MLINLLHIHLKLLPKIEIPKTKKAADDLIGKKIASKINSTKIVAKNSSQINSKPVESEIEIAGFDKEIPKERYISLEKRQKISLERIATIIKLSLKLQ